MTTTTPPAAWKDPQLDADFIERDRLLALIEPLSQAWDALDHRTDYEADERRIGLRQKLGPHHAGLAAVEKRIVTRDAVERAVNQLMPEYRTERAALVADIEPLKELSTIDPTVIRLIAARSRQLANLRHALFNATGLPEFSKDWNPIDILKEHWERQHETRQRIFSHTLAAGFPLPPVTPPWLDALAALREAQERDRHAVNA